jgi:DNA-binding NtrC family response regulator
MQMDKTPEPQNHQKTVLVVDDDAAVLKVVSAILAEANYNVLTAGNGSAALQQSRACKSDIHLLLSDFEMAGMNGMDLATQMSRNRPNLKVLLMSGFPDGMLVLNEGWHYLAKPFLSSQLKTLVSGLVFPESPSRFVNKK